MCTLEAYGSSHLSNIPILMSFEAKSYSNRGLSASNRSTLNVFSTIEKILAFKFSTEYNMVLNSSKAFSNFTLSDTIIESNLR